MNLADRYKNDNEEGSTTIFVIIIIILIVMLYNEHIVNEDKYVEYDSTKDIIICGEKVSITDFTDRGYLDIQGLNDAIEDLCSSREDDE